MAVLNHLANKLSVADQWKTDRRCCGDVAIAQLDNVELVLMKPRRLMNANGLCVAGAGESSSSWFLGETGIEHLIVLESEDTWIQVPSQS